MQTIAKDDGWLNSKFSVDYQLLRDDKKEKNILMVKLEHFLLLYFLGLLYVLYA